MNHKRKLVGAAVAAVMFTAAACGGDSGDAESDSGPITLSFESLAWQPPSVEANKRIVEEWNAANPDVQVEYVQGDWGSIGDQLTTSFEAGKAPDVFHFYDSGLQTYAARGDLLDLTGLLSDSFASDIREEAMANVSFAGVEGVWGVPFLQEPTLLFANKAKLDVAGIEVPAADDPWTWDEFAEYAKQLTVDENGDGTPETWGVAMPLLEGGVDRTLSLGLSFDAQYFTSDGKALEWGEEEAEVPTRFHDLMYADKSMSTDVLGLGPTDILPPFFDGQYALVFGGTYIRQQFAEGAPTGFDWVTLPPLMGTSLHQSNGAQTISVAAGTEHPEEAVAFLEYFLSPENQVDLALGDWLTPTSIAAAESEELTDPSLGWDVSIAASEHLVQGNYQKVAGYGEWTSKVANQAFADYYADKIGIEELATQLAEAGDPILARTAVG